MTAQYQWPLGFGAEYAEAGTGFRIWAPTAESITLELSGQAPVSMRSEADGWFSATVACDPGCEYRFTLPDGMAVPDPAARRQRGDVHGASVVVDPRSFAWQSDRWMGRPWHEAVILEVHPGVLGGFRGVKAKLEEWRDLGYTMIELMPIADFPGRHNWGYDGAMMYAVDEAYGSIDDLKSLIDHAHALGIGVLLDVVYNHFGPDGNYLSAYAGSFFDESRHTPWGAAIMHERAQVRDFYIQNALYWLMEYRFDGLRFDAVHAILDKTFPEALATAVRAAVEPGRHVHLVLEHEGNKASLIGPGKFDAQWTDDTHHSLHVLLTGETDGYYDEYSDAARLLARSLAEGFAFQGETGPGLKGRGEPSTNLPTTAFVIFLQNHDQIGNRAMGDRLTTIAHPEAIRAATALLMLSPQIPLFFMGDEVGSRAPFLFFTDHHDELADLVREGRRKEFARFAFFADPQRREQIPDPNDEGTFKQSNPYEGPGNATVTELHRTLLDIRHRQIMKRIPGTRSLGAEAIGKTGVRARWRMGDGAELTICCNFGSMHLPTQPLAGDVLFETSPALTNNIANGILPAHSTIALLQASV